MTSEVCPRCKSETTSSHSEMASNKYICYHNICETCDYYWWTDVKKFTPPNNVSQSYKGAGEKGGK